MQAVVEICILQNLRLLGGLSADSVGRLIGVRVFTTSQSYIPTDGTRAIIVEAVGGGGGGGGTYNTGAGQRAVGAGGGAGGYARARFTTGFTGLTITIGSGGIGGAANVSTAGGIGGTTRFGNLISAEGGMGGTFCSPWEAPIHAVCAPSGTATGGNLGNHSANAGSSAYFAKNGWLSGSGASSILGTGGVGVGGTSRGSVAAGYGSGGGGASTGDTASGQIGGAGSNGVAIVWEFA